MTIRLTCMPRRLPDHIIDELVRTGVAANRATLSVLVPRRWPAGGVRLTVGFLDGAPADLRAHVVSHMNAWAKTANVSFVETQGQAQVRISREGGDEGGYWSYLGTDILHIAKNAPTMNLEGFTMQTSEDEFRRVVRHETGHTLGFPHEHMRRDLVALINREKAIDYFGRTQGWTRAEVEQQVLTPIEESSLLGTPRADSNSIMCYEIPGEVTQSGDPIVGGVDIDELDYEFAASVYPK
ncbi:peptidase M12 [Methylocystis sp. H62]|uniref:M12 family metallopeptidase n=1 Tax=Methylocystis sp. H62 TaxID=2785789 RepID=UPI0018C304B2|nr:M12 family metallopeptidase [Methylocystis sp. H62]MBG0792242.1 peptidase M12 [Methylocystis sp. H62]